MFQMFHGARRGWGGGTVSAHSDAGHVEPRRSPPNVPAFGGRSGAFVLLAALALLLAACGRPTPALEHKEAAALLSNAKARVFDGRSRFREIYCAVRRDHGAALPFDRPCDDSSALWRLPGEPPPTSRSVTVGRVAPGTRVVMVPGLLAECVADLSKVFSDATANLEAQGYATGYIQTRGRQGSDANADIIRDAVMALSPGETLILVTHSKGTVDTLEALAKYPTLADRVAAVVSVSGAVYGSPLADSMPGALVYLGHQIPLLTCPPGENVEAVDGLRRSVRLAWFASHRLPARVRFYSLAAYAGPPDVSALLMPFWSALARTDPANDGLVVAADAIVPGSTLLGYPNADHLAVAMPFPPSPLMNHNDYPRAVLLEAAVRAVQEDLDRHPRAKRESVTSADATQDEAQ